MQYHDNYRDVVHQMEAFGIELRERDLPLRVDSPKRVTCGKGGKAWYWLRTFRPDAGGAYIVGRYGSYKTGESAKVEVDWRPLSEAERARMKAEREAARQREREAREREAALAAMTAAQLWRTASEQGTSPYLQRKGVEPEACRFLPDGSIVVPLLRYDLPRHEALRAVQRIYPGPRTDRRTGESLPQKVFTRGFSKEGCALRLGEVQPGRPVLLAEGYATALTIRMATGRRYPVFVCLDAHNLLPVARIVRALHADSPILVCADDDWQRRNPQTRQLENIGRLKAWEVARLIEDAHITQPVFGVTDRRADETDFNDLHMREGLDAVAQQLMTVLEVLDGTD